MKCLFPIAAEGSVLFLIERGRISFFWKYLCEIVWRMNFCLIISSTNLFRRASTWEMKHLNSGPSGEERPTDTSGVSWQFFLYSNISIEGYRMIIRSITTFYTIIHILFKWKISLWGRGSIKTSHRSPSNTYRFLIRKGKAPQLFSNPKFIRRTCLSHPKETPFY